ncbi:hypothetical protein T4B_329 [Trichinella pseudospiralis]|uniref:MULE transposase domain-containing protein n=1 Tax=Trichinella pseudospiralis TaxID=6337 RepID=A0A0V1HCR3_TRIPS|nr:hypothetical protein T4B_329 [Trichinella pseudospiralis]
MKKLPPRPYSQPSTSGYFSTAKLHRAKRYPKLSKHHRQLQISVLFRTTNGICWWYLLLAPTSDCWQPCEHGPRRVLLSLQYNAINNFSYHPCFCDRATVLAVNLNPHPALIPAIHGYFTNTQLHGCSMHYRQAVHRKVGELELKTRYRTEEETKREIKILLATAFLPSLYRMLVRVTACLKQVLWGIYLFWHVIQ